MADPKQMYEFTYIVSAVLNEDQTRSLINRVNKYIEEDDGEIVEVNEMGSQRLAYPINKKRNGYYVNAYFRAPGTLIQRLERAMEIDDDVLRYLTLKMDAKMIRHFERQQRRALQGDGADQESEDASSTPTISDEKPVR